MFKIKKHVNVCAQTHAQMASSLMNLHVNVSALIGNALQGTGLIEKLANVIVSLEHACLVSNLISMPVIVNAFKKNAIQDILSIDNNVNASVFKNLANQDSSSIKLAVIASVK